MFQASDLIVLNKIDVLPCVDFDIARSIAEARVLNPNAEVLGLSAKTGAGPDDRSDWIIRQLDKTEYWAFAAGDAVSSGVPRS